MSDFLVSPFVSFATSATTWLVTRCDGSPANAVAVYTLRQEAIDRAIEMARYHRSIGRAARVFVQERGMARQCVWPDGEA